MVPALPPGLDINADIKQVIIGPVIALMLLAGISVALRFASRLSAKATPQLDDYLIIGALIFAWGTGVLSILACYEGIGKHIWSPKIRLERVVKILWAYEFLYASVIPLTKLSIIFFYYRLFPVPSFCKILYVVLFLTIGWWIAVIIIIIAQCRPYRYFWEQYADSTTTGSCINIQAFMIGNGASSVITDFIILLTPIPMVWNLQMVVAQKLSVLGIFFLGGFVCIAGVIRVCALRHMSMSGDLTWDTSEAFVWSAIEPNVGIVCACLPTLRPLIRRCFPRRFGSTDPTPSSQQGYGTNYPRHRYESSDFFALNDRRSNSHKERSEDELGSTNEFTSDHQRREQCSAENSIALESNNAIMVKSDIEWSSALGSHS